MPFEDAEFMTQLMAPKPYPAQAVFDPPTLTPLRKPILSSAIAFRYHKPGRSYRET
jgi:hypothetical protein